MLGEQKKRAPHKYDDTTHPFNGYAGYSTFKNLQRINKIAEKLNIDNCLYFY